MLQESFYDGFDRHEEFTLWPNLSHNAVELIVSVQQPRLESHFSTMANAKDNAP
jgi:hypothetical protein